MKDNKILIGTALALLLLLTTGLSYAYFSTAVKGNDNAKNVVVEAGTLKLTYTDGPAINAQYIKPGWSTTKEVSVKNNGTLDTYYNVIWQTLTNTITNNELVLSATCQRLNASGTVEGTCESISQAAISDMTIAKKISIESGITHKYTFTILFKETNANQNYNQGKEFSGVLGIEESKTASPVAFSTDSWDTIVSAVKSGDTSVYKVGDTKEVNLGTTYGTHTIRIANMSTPTECSTSNFSQSACGFVLEFADIITNHVINTTYTDKGGWPGSEMYTFVNNDIYNSLPSDLKNSIINTTVVSSYGNEDTENFTSIDKLYLLSTAEVWANTVSSSNSINKTYNNSLNTSYNVMPLADTVSCNVYCDKARKITRQLDYYKNLSTTISNYGGAIKKNGTSVSYWWLRSAFNGKNTPYDNFSKEFYAVSASGNVIDAESVETSYGVSPAFRIG